MSANHRARPSLELVSSSLPGRLFEIEPSVTRIGRDPSSHIPLDLKQVSWNHARIVRRPEGGYVIEDLSSYNGTFLDGQRLHPRVPVVLADGSRIRITEVNLIFRSEAFTLRDAKPSETTILGALDDSGSLKVLSSPERSAEVLKAVLEINRVLGGTTEMDVALGRALDKLIAIFEPAECGFILTCEPDGRLTPRATRFGPEASGPPSLSRTVLEHVLNGKQAVLLADASDVPETISSESLYSSGIKTAMCVPVFGGRNVPIGIIQLDARRGDVVFQESDLELLAAVAVPIGVSVENNRLLRERASLAAAGEVQAALLPKHRPDLPGYTFWERYQPALEVGGDYYDYVPVETEPGCGCKAEDEIAGRPGCLKWVVAIGDVSGKGMPAALLMAKLSAEVRHLVRSGYSPSDVTNRVNREVYDADLPGRFVTFLLTLLDARTHTLTVVNAGHMAPLLRRADGRLERVGEAEADIPLGVERRGTFGASTTTLGAGDVVVLYTDGVTEAVGQDESFFGDEGLSRAIRPAEGGAAEAGDAVLRALRAHVGGRSQSDDIALVCFGRD